MGDQIRTTLLDAAQKAMFDLAKEVNGLLDTATMYVERYQLERQFTCREVAQTCLLISSRFKEITERVITWKAGTPPVLSRWGFKLNVVNEMSINCGVLYKLLTDAGIDVDFSPHIFKSCMGELLHCDHHLSR